MIITRRIEIFISEGDKALRKEYYEKLYRNRDTAMKIANMGISHMFMLDNTTPYLSQEDREKLEYLGCPKADGHQNKATKRNAPYVAASMAFKGEADMGMASCLLQEVGKAYQDDRKKGMWNKSLRSYKSNLPVPYKRERFVNLRFAEYTDGEGKTRTGCFFTLMSIPFQMKFGRDRSNNKAVVQSVIDGMYKMCTSSIKIDGKKIYLLLCVDIPKKEYEPIEGKTLHCWLGVANPIVCSTEVNAKQDYDSGYRVWEIGTKEEYLQRRLAIQAAVRRCQIANRYTKGGKGRKKKCQAIERWHDVENNYVDTKLHTYSRMLVDMAVKHRCAAILLRSQSEREDAAKGAETLVLRNWGYFGLKQKIDYKAKMYGIEVLQE